MNLNLSVSEKEAKMIDVALSLLQGVKAYQSDAVAIDGLRKKLRA